MDWGRRALRAGALLCLAGASSLASLTAFADPAAVARVVKVDFAGQSFSSDVKRVAEWAAESGDMQGKPFAVVDKKQAQIYVFDASGRLVGTSPTLLGLAKGDDSAPGVASKISTGIPLAERTTPAGRFESQPGHNLKGEAIVWVDYSAAVAIHRLRPAPAAERRPQRLASADPDERRISLGCIVVPPEFYDTVVAPTLGTQHGVVYVLPESAGADYVFNGGGGANRQTLLTTRS
ncbi:MAG TPA: hypothetical protein VGM81_11790 [Burkholderiaceae bacterium]|jgi:hypothetical protein